MAFIHTNFLTGNDSTGDGSTSTPYKTVYKAVQVAASNDTIKVAGGQWSSALSGDFTFTQDSNIITTSESQVGTVLVDDILSFEDSQFGFDKFHLKVLAVAAGTITTTMFWMGETMTVNTVKRLDAYHYSQAGTSPSAFETWSTTDIQPSGRTGITISGGWSSDYTVQGGWTVMRRTGQAITSTNQIPDGFSFTASGGIGDWGANLIWDRFMVHTIRSLWNFGTNTTSSFAMDELAVVKGLLVNGATSGFGLFQASASPAKLYLSNPGIQGNMIRTNASYEEYTGSQPVTFEIDIYASIGWNTANTQNGSTGAGFGMGSIYYESSKNQMNLYIRQNSQDNASSGSIGGYPSYLQFAGSSQGIYLNSLNYYMNKPQTLIMSLGSQTCQIEDMNLLGPSASKGCVFFSSRGGQWIVDLSQEGKTIDQFKFGTASLGTYNGLYSEGYLNQLCQTNLNQVQVKDVEGLKTVDSYNNIYYKTNGELKISSATSFNNFDATPYYVWKMIGVTDKPTGSFTVDFVLKVDTGAEAEWDTLAVQYGPNLGQIITQALTPTDEYATYSMTVNPASYADWTSYKFPVYFGIRSKTANTFLDETMSYVYIQSVNVTIN